MVKGLVVQHHALKDTNLVIPSPFWLPRYNVGTEVQVMYTDPDSKETYKVDGKILRINMEVQLNPRTQEQMSVVIYHVMPNDMEDFPEVEPLEVLEEEIRLYYPVTNDLDTEYYVENENTAGEEEEEIAVEYGPMSEAQVAASQEVAAGLRKGGLNQIKKDK